MTRYVLRRLLMAIPILIGVSIVVFFTLKLLRYGRCCAHSVHAVSGSESSSIRPDDREGMIEIRLHTC